MSNGDAGDSSGESGLTPKQSKSIEYSAGGDSRIYRQSGSGEGGGVDGKISGGFGGSMIRRQSGSGGVGVIGKVGGGCSGSRIYRKSESGKGSGVVKVGGGCGGSHIRRQSERIMSDVVVKVGDGGIKTRRQSENDARLAKPSRPNVAPIRTNSNSINHSGSDSLSPRRRVKQRAPLVTCGRTKCADCARKREIREKEEAKEIRRVEETRSAGKRGGDGQNRAAKEKKTFGTLGLRLDRAMGKGGVENRNGEMRSVDVMEVSESEESQPMEKRESERVDRDIKAGKDFSEQLQENNRPEEIASGGELLKNLQWKDLTPRLKEKQMVADGKAFESNAAGEMIRIDGWRETEAVGECGNGGKITSSEKNEDKMICGTREKQTMEEIGRDRGKMEEIGRNGGRIEEIGKNEVELGRNEEEMGRNEEKMEGTGRNGGKMEEMGRNEEEMERNKEEMGRNEEKMKEMGRNGETRMTSNAKIRPDEESVPIEINEADAAFGWGEYMNDQSIEYNLGRRVITATRGTNDLRGRNANNVQSGNEMVTDVGRESVVNLGNFPSELNCNKHMCFNQRVFVSADDDGAISPLSFLQKKDGRDDIIGTAGNKSISGLGDGSQRFDESAFCVNGEKLASVNTSPFLLGIGGGVGINEKNGGKGSGLGIGGMDEAVAEMGKLQVDGGNGGERRQGWSVREKLEEEGESGAEERREASEENIRERMEEGKSYGVAPVEGMERKTGGEAESQSIGVFYAVEGNSLLAWLPTSLSPSSSSLSSSGMGGKPDYLESRAKRLLAEAEWEKVVTSAGSGDHANKNIRPDQATNAEETVESPWPKNAVSDDSSYAQGGSSWLINTLQKTKALGCSRPGIPTLFVGIPSRKYSDMDCFLEKQSVQKVLFPSRVDGGIFKYASFASRAIREFLSVENDRVQIIFSTKLDYSLASEMSHCDETSLDFVKEGTLSVYDLLDLIRGCGCVTSLHLVASFLLNWDTVIRELGASKGSKRPIVTIDCP